MIDLAIDRRGLLRGGAGLVVSFVLPRACPCRRPASAPRRREAVAIAEVDSFLAIGRDGSVTVYSGKVDLGTGVRTALAQIAAERARRGLWTGSGWSPATPP